MLQWLGLCWFLTVGLLGSVSLNVTERFHARITILTAAVCNYEGNFRSLRLWKANLSLMQRYRLQYCALVNAPCATLRLQSLILNHARPT